MIIYLQISRATIDRYKKEDPNIADALTRAGERRESWLARRMVTEPKLATGCMYALKQPKNGGYIDKAADSTGGAIQVNVTFGNKK